MYHGLLTLSESILLFLTLPLGGVASGDLRARTLELASLPHYLTEH